MLDAASELETMRRPAVLIRAARHLVAMRPSRARLMRRALRGCPTLAGTALLKELAEWEAELERRRSEGGDGYSPQAHVEVLAALLSELSADVSVAQPKASGSAAFRFSANSFSDSRTPSSSRGA